MFIISWVFDKLGYMPKINMEVGKVDLQLKDAWPFPAEVEKPVVKKRKPALKKATTVAKKAK